MNFSLCDLIYSLAAGRPRTVDAGLPNSKITPMTALCLQPALLPGCNAQGLSAGCLRPACTGAPRTDPETASSPLSASARRRPCPLGEHGDGGRARAPGGRRVGSPPTRLRYRPAYPGSRRGSALRAGLPPAFPSAALPCRSPPDGRDEVVPFRYSGSLGAGRARRRRSECEAGRAGVPAVSRRVRLDLHARCALVLPHF